MSTQADLYTKCSYCKHDIVWHSAWGCMESESRVGFNTVHCWCRHHLDCVEDP